MYRDDEAARLAYVAALERKAARLTALEARLRELEAENGALEVENRGLRERLRGLVPSASDAEHPIDAKLQEYAAALIRATDPRRTSGILSGALYGDAAAVLDTARSRARTAGRRHVTSADVRAAALEILPGRILMIDPEVDPRGIVRAILDIVDEP